MCFFPCALNNLSDFRDRSVRVFTFIKHLLMFTAGHGTSGCEAEAEDLMLKASLDCGGMPGPPGLHREPLSQITQRKNAFASQREPAPRQHHEVALLFTCVLVVLSLQPQSAVCPARLPVWSASQSLNRE